MQIIADSHTVTVTVRPSSQKENPFRWATFCVRRRLQKPQGVHLEGRAWQIQLTWMHWPRPMTPLTVCKRNLKEARHHQVGNLQEAGSVRTADARFAGLAVPNEANRTTAAPWSRGAVMAINACGRKKKMRCIDGYKVESCISGCVAYQDNKDSHCGSWARRVCDCLRWAPCSRHNSPAASASRQSPDAGGRYLHAAA